MENMTQEQKVALAAGPKNFFNLGDSSKTNAKVAAAAPAPRPTGSITRSAMNHQPPQQR